jgi:hypothetical protein
MNCFYHPEQQAVAQCSICSKGLCVSCASQVLPPTCTTCFNKRIKSLRSNITKELLIMYGLGAILTFFLLKVGLWQLKFSIEQSKGAIIGTITMTVLTFYATSGITAGWKTLTKITPQVFLFLPLLGWALYFLVKFVLAFFVGLVMLPVRTVICIIKLNRLKPVK